MKTRKTYPITLSAMAAPAVREDVSTCLPATVSATIITTTTTTPEGV